MAAANCPETPRQRMITMMYLVYTAMLALNVSAEILQSFITVGDSLEVTNNLLLSKTESSYLMFENAYKNDPGKVGPNWQKAQEVRKETKIILDYIDDLKYELIANVDGVAGGKAEVKKLVAQGGYNTIQKKDNYDGPTNYFIGGSEDGSQGKAIELRKKIEAYQDKMMKLCDTKFQPQLKKIQIDTKGKYKNASGQELNWQMYNFYHTVLAADVVILNKFKSEIENSEYDLVNNLYSAISADDFKFDQVTARVIPKSTYIIQGGTYEADVIVAAYDSRSQLRGEVRGSQIVGDSGTLKLKFGAGALGPQKYKGTVYVKREAGEVPYDFDGEYFVAAPSATISATKMNVFYIGVDNPVKVGAPGIKSEDLVVTISGSPGATIKKDPSTKEPGCYIVNVKSQGTKAVIAVSAKIGNKVQQLGSQDYRIKVIPKPTVKVGNYQGGRIAKESLLAQGGFRVAMEGFDFPVTYNVTSYTMTFGTGGDAEVPLQGRGSKFTAEMTAKINKLRRGNKIYIDEIRVKGPDGEKAASNPTIVFTIQ
ncbi:MAG: gliding motility protein GldM [Bacteroidales bacterium]|nr:gliding motility protein GldM [Candidatus Scybalousia scybalohippi]MCQ2326014.1 gliding motility protein GldM [Bacteroidales bacterium]